VVVRYSMRFIALTISLSLIGCGTSARPSQPNAIPSTPVVLENGNRLDASMTDNELLQNLGLNPKEFVATHTYGKDGEQIVYRHGEQSVSIVRSLVTGTAIIADGPAVSGNWMLGGDAAQSD